MTTEEAIQVANGPIDVSRDTVMRLSIALGELSRAYERQRPRDIRKGQHPEPGTRVLVWCSTIGWHPSWPSEVGPLWMPAPLSPEGRV